MLDPSQATTLHHWKKVSVKRLIKTKAFELILLHGSMWDHPDTRDEFGKLMVTLQVSYKTRTCMSYPRMSRAVRPLENTDGAHLYVRAILKVAANCCLCIRYRALEHVAVSPCAGRSADVAQRIRHRDRRSKCARQCSRPRCSRAKHACKGYARPLARPCQRTGSKQFRAHVPSLLEIKP